MVYAYTCLVSDDEGKFMVRFPDIEGCVTEGSTIVEALELAEDALGLWLWDAEEEGETIAPPTPFSEIHEQAGEVKSLIRADTVAYRKAHSKKVIQKAITLPEWLDTMARKKNINFSNFVQTALMKELGVYQ